MSKRTKTIACALLLVGLAMLAGCSSENVKDEPSVFASPTPAPVAWRRPQAAISQETFAQVRLTGLMRLHQGTVNGVAFSASGTRLASAGADNTTVIWNLASGESLFEQEGNDGRRVFFGPDDTTLVTVSSSGLARVWQINMRPPRQLQQITSFAGHDSPAGIVVQSPDRTLLAFGSENGGVRLWHIPEGEVVSDFEAHAELVQNLVFSPDGSMLATSSRDLSVRVWSVPDGDLLYDFSDPAVSPLRAVFSPDSAMLAVAHITGVQLWDLNSGEQVYAIETASYAAANALVFSPDGNLLAGCGNNPIIGVWDAASGELLGGLPLPGQVCASIAFSPDSKLLVTLPSPGRDVFLWDIVHITDNMPPEEKQLRRRNRDNLGIYPGAQFYDVAWSDDGRFLVLIDELGPLYVLTAAQ
jgi:WD40 repeat protein